MCRKLSRAQTQSMKISQDPQIPVEVIAAFNIKHSCHLAFGTYTFDVVGIEGKLN